MFAQRPLVMTAIASLRSGMILAFVMIISPYLKFMQFKRKMEQHNRVGQYTQHCAYCLRQARRSHATIKPHRCKGSMR
jgi:hypothetical protein